MDDLQGLVYEAAVDRDSVTFSNEQHKLTFATHSAGGRVVISWDGKTARSAIYSFVTWDKDAYAEVVFTDVASAILGIEGIEFAVAHDAEAAFDAIYAMLDASGELPDLTKDDLEHFKGHAG